MALRYMNFAIYGKEKGQIDVLKKIQKYYPDNTGFVCLTMDMDYMGAGLPKTSFEDQLEDLQGIKRNGSWKDKVYPFIFTDPRRVEAIHPREKKVNETRLKKTHKDFTGAPFVDVFKKYIESGVYQGIKIYPALGYYPFDKRMKPIYDFAVKNSVPIMTHCTIGAVHFKYCLEENERFHPFLKKTLPNKKPGDFQEYFTHPLNFECLLNPDILKKEWGENTPNYHELKICLGHWGTCEDWHSYLDDAWNEMEERKSNSNWPSLRLSEWHTEKGLVKKNYSWFTVICDLMRKYPNVYADISYTLHDETLLPLLKMILEADPLVRKKVLFGTDFYLVSKAKSERSFSIHVRAALGEELFEQIAVTNAEAYLSNTFNAVNSNMFH